jgi:peptidoglycan-N-acetylmuramic acid deacetylase
LKKFLALAICAALLAGCSSTLKQPVAAAYAQAPTDTVPASAAPASTATSTPAPTDSPVPTATPTPTPSPPPTAPPVISAGSIDTSGYSNDKLSWYFIKHTDHHQPPGCDDTVDITPFGGYYLGDTSHKYIYLTFDEGYENGYTGQILDTLKEKGVTAAFFCVGTYIRDDPDLVMRMVNEGHIVGSHTETHRSLPDLTDAEVLDELYTTAGRFKELTGKDMPAFLRPPSGEYSERVLALTHAAGYKTIFWSYAYVDWEIDNQPGPDTAYNNVMDYLHNGEILLLHAVSSSSAEALPRIIDSVRGQGYEFKTLYDLPDN